MDKIEVLEVTNGGLKVFKQYFPDLKRTGEGFIALNTYRGENNPSYYVSCDKDDKYWGKDYGDESYCGDCFTLISVVEGLDLKSDFRQILEIAYSCKDVDLKERLMKRECEQKNQTITLDKIPFSEQATDYWLQYGVDISNLNEGQSACFFQIESYSLQYNGRTLQKTKLNDVGIHFAFSSYPSIVKIYTPIPKDFRTYKSSKSYSFQIDGENFPDILILTAGEKDALVLNYHLGISTVCFQSESSGLDRSWLKGTIEEGQTVKVLFDTDETGVKSAKKLKTKWNLDTLDLSSVVPVHLRKKVKDVSDYFKLGLPKENLIQLITEENKHEETEVLEECNTAELDLPEELTESTIAKLPELFADILRPHSEQKNKEMLMLSSLVVLSSIFPNVSTMYNKRIHCNLYGFLIAPAASGKGIIEYTRKLLTPIEDYHNKLYLKEFKKWQKSKEKEDEPTKITHVIPANASSSAFIEQLDRNNGCGLIFQTEADTLASMLKNDWSNYSDALRMMYEHETYSQMRKSGIIQVRNPKCSVLLSGTPSQVFGIIPNVENGLFSRFIFLQIEAETQWINVFNQKNDLEEYYKELSEKVLIMFHEIKEIDSINFVLSESQQNSFHEVGQMLNQTVLDSYGEEAISIPRRMAGVLLRIAMLLSVVRAVEENRLNEVLECKEDDFECAKDLYLMYARNSLVQYQILSKQSKQLTNRKLMMFFDKLPLKFKFADALEIGEELDCSKSGIEKYLRDLQKNQMIEKLEHNSYQKME